MLNNYLRMAPGSGPRKRVRLYQIWDSMKKRCDYPLQNRYERYGGRGITICAEWRDYAVFRKWAIANGYTKGLTLDRINNDGNYEPGNCRWIPAGQQQWNSKATIHLTANGVTKPLPVWARELGVRVDMLRTRRLNGWTDEQIVLTPFGAPRIGYVPQKRGRKPKSRIEKSYSSNQTSAQE